MTIEQIEKAILNLSETDFTKLKKWLLDLDYQQWDQQLIMINLGDGILLKSKKVFPETKLADVAGCLKYEGKAKTIEEMDEAIAKGIEKSWNQ